MSTLELEKVEKGTDQPPKMTHLLDVERGFPWALCGTRCRTYVNGKGAECVVCWDIWESKQRQK